MKQALVVGAVLALAACGGGEVDGLEVSDVRIGQPTGPNAALYFTVVSEVTDRLMRAETEVATSVEIHESISGEDGTMGMRAVEGLEVRAGETVVLEPGGVHLMLIGADRLEVGDQVEVVLTWENTRQQTVTATVVAPEDAMGHEGHDG